MLRALSLTFALAVAIGVYLYVPPAMQAAAQRFEQVTTR